LFVDCQCQRPYFELMARTARRAPGGVCYHAINRGNRRATVFHTDDDYDAFEHLIGRACVRVPMRVLAYCLMPNHFHFVLWPHDDGDMSRWMHWLLTSHVVRYHKIRGTSGRIWQGRYKAFPIEQDHHLLTVLRYVERNPVRANLVDFAIDWKWSSVARPGDAMGQAFLSESPVTKPPSWINLVDQPHTNEELDTIRRCSFKRAPFGSGPWVAETVAELGLKSSLRGPGRPKRGHS